MNTPTIFENELYDDKILWLLAFICYNTHCRKKRRIKLFELAKYHFHDNSIDP